MGLRISPKFSTGVKYQVPSGFLTRSEIRKSQSLFPPPPTDINIKFCEKNGRDVTSVIFFWNYIGTNVHFPPPFSFVVWYLTSSNVGLTTPPLALKFRIPVGQMPVGRTKPMDQNTRQIHKGGSPWNCGQQSVRAHHQRQHRKEHKVQSQDRD